MKEKLLPIICMILFCSCSFLSYQGKSVTQTPIVLKDGDGVWKSDDLSVNYQCQRDQNNFRISGVVNLGNGIANNFSCVEYFWLRIHFADAQGKILGTRLLADSGYMTSIRTWIFKRNIPLPQGAEAMVFDYAGRAVDGGEDLTSWDFWITP